MFSTQALAVFAACIVLSVEAGSKLECGITKPCRDGFVCRRIASSPLKQCVPICHDVDNPCQEDEVCDADGYCKIPTTRLHIIVLATVIPFFFICACCWRCAVPAILAKWPGLLGNAGQDTPTQKQVQQNELNSKLPAQADFCMDMRGAGSGDRAALERMGVDQRSCAPTAEQLSMAPSAELHSENGEGAAVALYPEVAITVLETRPQV